jgi:hypothetical protein
MKKIRWNNAVNILLMFTLFGALFSACQIEKRVHRPGYHVQYKKSNPGSLAKVEQSKENKRAKEAQMHAFIESDEFSASAKDELLIAKEKKEIKIEKPVSKVENLEIFKSDIVENYTDCETLVYTNGVEALVKIEEITPQYIKYTRCDLQNGPLISVKKTDVYKIVYSNGVEDIITDSAGGNTRRISANEEAVFDGIGLVSFIAGLTAFLIAGIILGPVAIIFGLISVIRTASINKRYKGKAFGVIGLILGLIGTIIMILYFSSL